MTRKYSGEFAHKNYASLFCEVFDSHSNFCALFHYRVYCGKPMLTIDNVSLSSLNLKYEVMNFLSKAVVSCNFPNPVQMSVELTDLPLF